MSKIRLLVVVIVVLLFAVIFKNSNTLEVWEVTEVRDGIEYYQTKHRMYWDRFFNYTKNLPEHIQVGFRNTRSKINKLSDVGNLYNIFGLWFCILVVLVIVAIHKTKHGVRS